MGVTLSVSISVSGLLDAAARHPGLVGAPLLAGVVAVLVVLSWLIKGKGREGRKTGAPATPVLEKGVVGAGNLKGLGGQSRSQSTRACGEWTPVAFDYPAVSVHEALLQDRPPAPYRPFRWGKYNVTMGIRSMPWDEWIEVDNQLPMYHKIRTDRVERRGEKAVRTLPPRPGCRGGADAAKELAYELAEFLSRRYPDTYSVTRHAPREGDYGWHGEGQVKTITVIPVDATYDLDTEDPMKVAGLLVEDDLALMIEGEDGKFYFQAGAIIVPGFWRMEDKIGMPLEDIHVSGAVPQYKEKLMHSMNRFFSKLTVDKPVIRNNYFFQVVRPEDDPARRASLDPDELAWSHSTNGDEDRFKHHTRWPVEFLPEDVKAEQDRLREEQTDALATDSVGRIRLRTERQTLRRLPRSGAIAFTIRTYIFNVVDIVKEPGVPGRMASAIRSWPEDVQLYKGEQLYGSVILPYLDQKHKEQVEDGLVAEGDEKQNYPY